MPLIEFKCKCGSTFERLMTASKVTDGLICKCMKCGRFAPRVLYSQTGTPILKGEGFYKPTQP